MAPGLDRLSCLYGTRADSVVDAAKITVSSLRAFLASTQNRFDQFKIPFASISFGPERQGSADDLPTLLRNALMISSSLGEWSLDQKDDETDDATSAVPTKIDSDRLVLLVRDLVAIRHPDWKPSFNVPLNVGTDRVAPRIGFLGSTVVANFDLIRPNRITSSLKGVRTSLWSLLLHRDTDPLTGHVPHLVYLHRPGDSDPQWSQQQLGDVAEACSEARTEAAQKDLLVEVKLSANEIADDLLARAA